MNAAMQSQYRTHQQIPQRSPRTTSSRRGPGPMVSSHAPQQPTNAQLLAAQNQAKMETEAAKRRAHKPTDKNMPEGIEDLIIGDGVDQYKRLRDMERRLDAVMMRKRLDMQDSTQHGFKRYKTLRVWISNTVENQPWQGRSLDENAFDFNTGLEATYKVRIEGRLLDDDQDSDKESDDEGEGELKDSEKNADSMDHDGDAKSEPAKPTPERPRYKLSYFFKSITVDFDRGKNFQPETATQIEWKKPPIAPNNPSLPAAADFDSIEFERKSDENLNCTINFYRDESPERFHLSKELTDVVDAEEDDKTSVYYGIWEYVKAMGLQQDEEKRLIQCDDRLRRLFKTDTVFFPDIQQLLAPHLSPLPPLALPYTIRVDPTFQADPTPTIYDITVSLPSTLPTLRRTLASAPTPLRQLATLDDHLALLIQAITHSKAKHAFCTEMSRDPVNFLRKWISSQKRDMEVILGEGGRFAGDNEGMLGDEWRRGGKRGVWGSESVRESVGLMVGKSVGVRDR